MSCQERDASDAIKLRLIVTSGWCPRVRAANLRQIVACVPLNSNGHLGSQHAGTEPYGPAIIGSRQVVRSLPGAIVIANPFPAITFSINRPSVIVCHNL